MFYGIPDLTTFVIGTIFIVLLPGPNSLYVVALAAGAVPGDQARGRSLPCVDRPLPAARRRARLA